MMPIPNVVLLTIPGLRKQDLDSMPSLQTLAEQGRSCQLSHHFPAVTWPSQANMLTGKRMTDHGVVANGFYWRDDARVEMWTAWNEKIEKPQIWDLLKMKNQEIRTAAWFPMLSKGCGADFVCMPAPIHRPDGSEDLWCYTRPQAFYGELLESIEHFPLQHFWGPLANIKSTQWIVDSMLLAAQKFSPNFSYVYLPHLDYAAQKFGPNSEPAQQAVVELDSVIAEMIQNWNAISAEPITWIALSEYTIQDVNHVSYPNRVLREAGLLSVTSDDDGKEIIDFQGTPAWALVDHQFSHVFVRNREDIPKVAGLFQGLEGIEHVLHGKQLADNGLAHERSGEVVLVSNENSWQAYYWWLDDACAPAFAHQVDIHRKPGYDPVELCFDMATRSVPLDASLIKGSHGRGILPAISKNDPNQQGVLVTNHEGFTESDSINDLDVCDLTMRLFENK